MDPVKIERCESEWQVGSARGAGKGKKKGRRSKGGDARRGKGEWGPEGENGVLRQRGELEGT